jgi:hypothetical protein
MMRAGVKSGVRLSSGGIRFDHRGDANFDGGGQMCDDAATSIIQ